MKLHLELALIDIVIIALFSDPCIKAVIIMVPIFILLLIDIFRDSIDVADIRRGEIFELLILIVEN